MVQCWEDHNFHKWLAVLLAEEQRRPEVPSVVSVDLLALPEDLRQLYILSNRTFWLREFGFEAQVREWPNLLAGCRNVELFSICTSERPSCYRLRQEGGRGETEREKVRSDVDFDDLFENDL